MKSRFTLDLLDVTVYCSCLVEIGSYASMQTMGIKI